MMANDAISQNGKERLVNAQNGNEFLVKAPTVLSPRPRVFFFIFVMYSAAECFL
jgi:hypothetical protein